ncbi:hypothetical protein E3Q10_01130 [Wallemia mellicola]|uniref:Uncharacterized protein n=1 Tax=Wallemia mellicola TaxID=1708541 RepID=A0A4V4MTD5_9BASI|nr:hypothetical protein E3Q24_04437 [Wallemia mellicola]TIB93870.1 hypothetical protein E3Q19_00847 [Wallemia mellicola]TIC07350.1 hypothetical protein E3Q16_00512 [Wallemia mellicola]TIC11126.1 hypothetical protein E3Q13_04438 [Wallemia mellicola]TIC25743.1 hypothetical protein E3Q12_00790 [Wallemia mellicola]
MVKVTSIILASGALFHSAVATTYAQFCNDNNCEEGCGGSVSVDNSACLVENGRGRPSQSVKFHDTNFGSVSLIATNNDQCSCQAFCYPHVVKALATSNDCLDLKDPLHNFKSFRFVNVDLAGGCSTDENTCDGSVQ